MFYIYGLFDPIKNEYFYIGKGKGKRFDDHFKKNKWDFNSAKIERIRSLEEGGFPAQIKIIIDGLSEEIAYSIEKELICRIGRKCFHEGPLLNLAPGGKWANGQSPFYSEDFIQSDFKELHEFSHIINQFGVKNKGKRKITQDSEIYKYDINGEFLKITTLEELFNGKIEGYELELFNQLYLETFPIINRFIYSLEKIDKITFAREIPFGAFDVFDPQMHKNFLLKKGQEENFELTSVDEFGIRLWIKNEKNLVSYKCFYQNGKCKSERTYYDCKPTNSSIDYNEMGHKVVEMIHIDGNSSYIRRTFYDNGNPQIEFSQINGDRKYKRWYRNGDIEIDE